MGLEDDCGGKWCNKGLAYDYDEPTLKKAAADNVAKTHHFNGSTLSDEHAKAAASAAGADASAKGAANAAAGTAKSSASAEFAGTSYKDKAAFKAAEAANGAAVHAKEAALDASLTAAKARSDANLKSNQERFAWESDQLERGQNQDRLKKVNEDTVAKTSEIQGKHDEREGANGRLLKGLPSF